MSFLFGDNVQSVMLFAAIAVLLLCQSIPVAGSVHHVPLDFPTIQAALNIANSGDTISVAPGVYSEFLASGTNNLLLTGWHRGDTLESFRTVLDPVPMGLDTPHTLHFTGDSARVSNLAIRNRVELRQPEWATRTGGIRHDGLQLVLTNCLFDSVSVAVHGGRYIKASDCHFVGCLWQCLYPIDNGVVEAIECSFNGSGNWLVRCFSGSRILDSRFICNETRNDLLSLAGENILVSGCSFGPCFSGFPALRVYSTGGCRIEHCEFQGIDRVSSLIEVSMDCPVDTGNPIEIVHNTFENYHAVPPAQGTPAIRLLPQSEAHCSFGVIDGNTFRDADSPLSAGIETGGSVEICRNLFAELSSAGAGDVYAYGHSSDTVLCRSNTFLLPGVAANSVGPSFDARWNWWGDSTGPFHASLNPGGLGTEVGTGVEFIPWLTSPPDTSDTTSASEEVFPILAELYSLIVYPNPFNAETTLELEVARVGDYRVVLYDVTGREAARLFSGKIERRLALNVSAKGLASGVYFAQLRGTDGVLAARKVALIK